VHILRSVLLSWVLVVAGCQTPTRPEGNALLGLWQYPEREVWIEIGPDMSAFQCRIALNNVVISSWGEVVGSASINWTENWGPDRIRVTPRTLTIDGAFGVFTFAKPARPMSQACLAARANRPDDGS
jgi:hypothetical protein